MMTPSGEAHATHGHVTSHVGTGGARFAGIPSAINVSLAGLLLLFVASHLLYLVLIHPSHLSPQLSDELYVGTIAQELVTGLTLPFPEYRGSNHMLGTLVIGALAAGFFLLCGPTVFALKLASLLVFTLALVFWYWTIQRYAGERVAGYFALLFCFSPPLFTAYSVASLGDHADSILFSALTVFLLFSMLSEEKPSPVIPALLGLTAGVGLWFCYTYGLTLLALLGFWFWHDKGMLRRPRVLWFALGFVVGFSPWIVINVQNHFAGLMVRDKHVYEYFGLAYLWDGLSHPWTLAPVEFLRTIASDDAWDLYRRAVNLLYALLYLGPILTVGVLRLKTGRSAPAGPSPTRPTLVGFGILYVMVFALAVQFSGLRAARYNLPAYPFLFLFVAYSLVRCQDLLPHVQRQIQTVFLASVVVLGLGSHAPLLSLDRPGYALSAKGYTYALMPETYLATHAPAGVAERGFLLKGDHDFLLEVVQRPFLSAILPKLAPDDQRDLSRALVLQLADAAPLNGQAEDFSRFERVVPPGFERHFSYQVGAAAMGRHPNELSKALSAVEFVRHRSAAAHHLALVGIYRSWPRDGRAALDRTLESLVASPAGVPPELLPHYWRAFGYWAGRAWYNTDRSLSQLNARVQAFVPQLEPHVQRSVLQGVGQFLFPYLIATPWVPPGELERFPQTYHQGLLEGWGMALGEDDQFSSLPWKGQQSPFWTAWTKGFSARSLSYVQQGKAQFDALFEGPASSALEPPLRP
jgi:4-amino-4-deoxy-L-arabinose transferase-like glycosyltransferase